MQRIIRLALVMWLVIFTCGCSTTPPDPIDPRDPLEHINRDAFRFNDKFDKGFLKPSAKVYKAVTPYFFRSALSNFFSNLRETYVIGNDILQVRGAWAMSDSWRFVVNSTVGLLGTIDVAKHIGLMSHDNDFGLTLNTWGFYSDYLMVPFLGPKTMEGFIGMIPDYYMGIDSYYVPFDISAGMFMLDGLNTRAQYLKLEQTASGFMFDPYIFYRNAYLQQRAYQLKINRSGPYFPGYDTNDEYD
ncbi:MAG: VacJ family lipoprotein [Gammaproteobacteria bacterium]|nr:VacJ family lipoprotein [Gammaproteobacteria bacterium]